MSTFTKGIRSRGFLAIVGLLALGVASTAMAVPMLPSGPIDFKFNGREMLFPTNQSVTFNGNTFQENNWGVGKLSSIDYGGVTIANQKIDDTGNPTGLIGGGNHYYFMFYGLTTNGTTSNGGAKEQGGKLDLYYSNNGLNLTSLRASQRTGESSFTGITNGTLLANLDFVPGVIQSDTTTTVVATAPNNITSANNGAATGYLSVDPNSTGAWVAKLNSNYFLTNSNGAALPNAADMFFNNTISSGSNFASSNAYTLDDPAQAYAVPAPSTLLILGAGLIALGFVSRRRFGTRS